MIFMLQLHVSVDISRDICFRNGHILLWYNHFLQMANLSRIAFKQTSWWPNYYKNADVGTKNKSSSNDQINSNILHLVLAALSWEDFHAHDQRVEEVQPVAVVEYHGRQWLLLQ